MIDKSMKDISCQHCGMACNALVFRDGGHVSDCHGVGIGYVNERGEDVFENEDLRYINDWNS